MSSHLILVVEEDPATRAFLAVIWRCCGASSTSLNLPSPVSFEALSAVRLRCRQRPWSGGCRSKRRRAA